MKINIKYKNLDSTAAFQQHVEEKIGALEKFVERMDRKGVVEAWVEVSRESKHHHKGDVYKVVCDFILPGKQLRAESEGWDARLAVDEVKDILDMEIKKYKEKFRAQDSRGQAEARKARGKD